MLIQFIHPKDTNQTAVKTLSQQLQQFFNVTDYRINVGWIHSRTRSDQGFNIRSVKGSERYYLHTGKEQTTHQIGDLILFSYADSTRCEDRLDIVTHIGVDELFDTQNSSLIMSFLEFFYVIYAITLKSDLYKKLYDKVCQLLLKQQYEHAVYQMLKKLIKLRKQLPQFQGQAHQYALDLHNEHVFGVIRQNRNHHLFALYNFSELTQRVPTEHLRQMFNGVYARDVVQGRIFNLNDAFIELSPYEFVWCVKDKVE